MSKKKMQAVIEAVLFTMGESVELDKLALAVDSDKDTVRQVIADMMKQYEKEDYNHQSVACPDNYLQDCFRQSALYQDILFLQPQH